MEPYLIPAEYGRAEYIEKKSRFIGEVFPVTTEDEIRDAMEQVKKREYDAKHHCWCYILRSGAKRYTDGGEPQGTAGVPRLSVFEREGVQDVLCVVTRYFGGILLGTGGLARAYGKAAKDALDAAGIAEMRVWRRLAARCPYAFFERVKLELDGRSGILEDSQFGADITLNVLLPDGEVSPFTDSMRELSAGKLVFTEVDTVFRGFRVK